MIPRPPDRVDHSWRCADKGPLVESTARQPNGFIRVVVRCEACGGTDLAHRMKLDAAERTDRDQLAERRQHGVRERKRRKLDRAPRPVAGSATRPGQRPPYPPQGDR